MTTLLSVMSDFNLNKERLLENEIRYVLLNTSITTHSLGHRREAKVNLIT